MFTDVSQLPQWLGAAILAAVISLLGFLGKLIIELVRNHRERRKKRLARLIELCSLLNASYDVYQKQNGIARALCQQVGSRLEKTLKAGQTMDSLLSSCYPQMNEGEKESHSILRGYSHALQDLNGRMLSWLQKDFEYKTAGSGVASQELSRQLNRLETHLYLWMAKFNVWIPPHPHHSLVYLKDEAYHGTGFPKEIEGSLSRFLEEKHHTHFSFSNRQL